MSLIGRRIAADDGAFGRPDAEDEAERHREQRRDQHLRRGVHRSLPLADDADTASIASVISAAAARSDERDDTSPAIVTYHGFSVKKRSSGCSPCCTMKLPTLLVMPKTNVAGFWT